MNTEMTILFLTVLATGLLAGLFYGYSCSVNGGLGNLSDEKYLEAFQSIDRVIQNPVFMLSFIGPAFLLPLATLLAYQSNQSASLFYLLVAVIVYFTGVLGITFFGNIPLNEKLANFSIATASIEDIVAMRRAFEVRWNIFHFVRTIASIIAFCAAILAIVKHKPNI